MELKTTISTVTEQTVSQASSVVTIVTQEDILATGATNLADVLENVPGVHIRRNAFGFRPMIQIRGATDKQTLLMVNGSPLRDLVWSFSIFWKGLPTSMIDRIEIIRGPGSAMYGSDASAGVINVITKTASGKIDHSEVGARAGSFDSKAAWMQHGTQWNGFDVAFTADLQTTDGHDPFIERDAQTRNDETFGSNASYAPANAGVGWKNTDLRLSVAKGNWQLRTDYMSRSDLEIGLTGAGVIDPVTKGDDSLYNIDLFYKNDTFSDDWGLDAELRYQNLDYSSGDGFQEFPPGTIFPDGEYPDGLINQMRSAERRLVFDTSGLYSGLDGHAIRLGAGVTWQDLYSVEQFVNFGIGPDGNPLPAGGPLVDLSDTPYAFAPEKMRIIRHIFLQDVWTLNDDWELTAGARYEIYSDFGETLNPRLAVVWNTTDKLTTKLMYGTAFRAPSYLELYAETSFTLPNPDLKPERSQTWDLSFSYKAASNLHLGMNFFSYSQTDLIRALDAPGLPKRMFQNQGDHSIVGIELETWWQATDKLTFSANYTHRNPDDDAFRAFDATDEAYLRGDWGFKPDWNWNLQTKWIGEVERHGTDTRPPVDDYWLTDTTLRYNASKQWEFAASIRNLFDVDARDYTSSGITYDLPLPERNYYLETRYRF